MCGDQSTLKIRTKKVILGIGAICTLLILYVITSGLIITIKLRKVHLGMTEADVIVALGEPVYASAYEMYTKDGKSSGKMMKYYYPYIWDEPLRIATGFLCCRYYNPRYISLDFEDESPTVTSILYHSAYSRGVTVIARKQ